MPGPGGLNTKVAVLLATYNGERFLAEQCLSILNQSGVSIELFVSDDGSSDGTLQILERISDELRTDVSPKLAILDGPRMGATQNFLSLVLRQDIDADFFAYCDQDDVWYEDKLKRAIEHLHPFGAEPALYCSSARYTSAAGDPQGLTPRRRCKPSFGHALVQNIAGGNSMVFNRAAREILLAAGSVDVVLHDWWTYLLLTAAGSTIVYDPKPGLDYRMHDGNLVGSNSTLGDRWMRLRDTLHGKKREWRKRHVNALMNNRNLLSSENTKLLAEFAQIESLPMLDRLKFVLSGRIYVDGFLAKCGLCLAALSNDL